MTKDIPISYEELQSALGKGCNRTFGALDQQYLCQSLGALNPTQPICVNHSENMAEVLNILQKEKLGCVPVVDDAGKLVGIFSERDWILKVAHLVNPLNELFVKDMMTKNPVAEKMDTTLAFALSLMSQGGFRHLPIVDDEHVPVGMISIKNLIDHIVEIAMTQLLDFDTEN